VVLTRTVEPGKAVAASLQAVTLFTVAEDLTSCAWKWRGRSRRRHRAGRPEASFTVSAYPRAATRPRSPRVASTKTDNVVTYTTRLEVDNADLSLRPGMTATATITATERQDVLLVPNTALRFTPTGSAPARRRRCRLRAKAASLQAARRQRWQQWRHRRPADAASPRQGGSRQGGREQAQAPARPCVGAAGRPAQPARSRPAQRWPHDRGGERSPQGRRSADHRPAQRASK
jgi:HlyD family secretion protein